ncbi:hypothetical protein DESC_480067 [Desulfosarcina cetonica]|nr:hypothetical protein DESC_480067 [Desulfosarcina cetonica]
MDPSNHNYAICSSDRTNYTNKLTHPLWRSSTFAYSGKIFLVSYSNSSLGVHLPSSFIYHKITS